MAKAPIFIVIYRSRQKEVDMKAGIKTTEFWITVAVCLGSVAAEVAKILPDKWAAILIGISTVAYTISRGLAK